LVTPALEKVHANFSSPMSAPMEWTDVWAKPMATRMAM